MKREANMFCIGLIINIKNKLQFNYGGGKKFRLQISYFIFFLNLREHGYFFFLKLLHSLKRQQVDGSAFF